MFLQDSPFHSPSQAPLSQGDCRPAHAAHILPQWHPCWHCFWSRSKFILQLWKSFCWALGALASLLSGFHPNGQMERANQDLEATICWVTANNPATWCTHLAWIEYAHSSLTSFASGMSLFDASLGYQPPLFPAHEEDIVMPLIQAHLHWWCKVWSEVRAALLSVDCNWHLADHHRPWLLTSSLGRRFGSWPKMSPSKPSPRNLPPVQ